MRRGAPGLAAGVAFLAFLALMGCTRPKTLSEVRLGMEIGEINVVCRDLERSVRFYRDALGFAVEERGGAYARVRCGAQRFLLLATAQRDAPRAPFGEVTGVSVDLVVDSLTDTIERLRRHGVAFEKEPVPGGLSCWVRDPDGNVFEVVQRGLAPGG